MDPRISASFARGAERARRHVDRPHRAERLGLLLARTLAPTPMVYVRYPPCLSIVLSGRKRSLEHESDEQEWGSERFLITPVDLPVLGRVVGLGDRGDFISVNWRLDPAVVAEVAAQLPRRPHEGDGEPERLGTMTPELADAIDRLLALLDAPEEVDVLAPLVEREIVLRLLLGDQAPRLMRAVRRASAEVVTEAERLLDADLARPWSVEELALAVGTSPATLRRRFRELTGLAPVAYLRRLRLGEARRRMLAEGKTATMAGAGVGYLSPSHFSRDYRAAYGTSPGADAAHLRAGVG
ncbi:AraC family transcriptional regulator [Litorihabitans aurantiacus]|uniref:AraC family transcriptional regulator n=1 Tax=Litorihabitans aurantiacus TaxID=1930061 RepID=UPI0024E13F7D|nr:AraC family transcriptional regulator [Litorihabitans aurantiacus]